MKKEIVILIFIFLAIIFQISFMPLFFSSNNVPDFVLVCFVSFSIIFGFQSTWIWAIVIGLLLDFFSFEKVGSNVISFILSCYVVSFFSKRVLLGEKLGGAIAGIFLIFILTFFNNFWTIFSDNGFDFWEIWKAKNFFLNSFLWKFSFNLIIFFVSLFFVKKFQKKKYLAGNIINY